MKDALNAVIDEIASGGIKETITLLPKTKRRSKKVVDGDNSEWNDTSSETQQPKSAVKNARKRGAAEIATSSSRQVNKPKRARKQTSAKLLEKNDTRKGKGKFSKMRNGKSR